MLWDLAEERSGKNHGNDKVEHALGARRGESSFSGLRVCGKASGKLGMGWMDPGLW